MRQILVVMLSVLAYFSSTAQLTVQSGATFYLSSNAQVTLQDVDLVNNGTITVAANGRFIFNGVANSFISGTSIVAFNELEIAKTGSDTLTLQNMIDVNGKIVFTNGLIDLNSKNINLGSIAFLENENENSRTIGSLGGQLIFSTTLNGPVAVNPANLGAIITSTQNLGTVTISRGHKSQSNGLGFGSSILRYYDITPTNNTNLNASFRFQYFDHELNGLVESNLMFWKSLDNVSWSNEGFTSRDIVANYVEKTGISDFSRWTLSPSNSLLLVRFSLFNVQCLGNQSAISWSTAQEQNMLNFTVERSLNGTSWTPIGTVTAVGNSSIEQRYGFTDDHPVPGGAIYRVVAHDITGQQYFTSMIHASCEANDSWKLWPNPVLEKLWLNINTLNASTATIKIFDQQGALIKLIQYTLMTGTNQIDLDVKNLSAGTYRILLNWNNGQMERTGQFIKM